MYDTIKALCAEGTPVAIFDDLADTSKFKFGLLLCVDETRFAMCAVTPNGDYDGIVVDDTEDIFRVDTCGPYHNKMAKLNRVRIDELEHPLIEPGTIDKSILVFAEKLNKLVSIELNNSGVKDITGFVENISGNICKIHVISEYGYDDGCSYIEMDSISQITVDSEDEQRIARLYQSDTYITPV